MLKSKIKVLEIAKDLAVSHQFVEKWTKKEREQENEERNAKILAMYLKCFTQEQIADEVGLSQPGIKKVLDNITNTTDGKSNNDFKPQLYDVWNLGADR